MSDQINLHNIASKDKPLVTFALLAYNQEKFIREAVEAALAQTYQPLEIILSDDNSSDSTFEIIKEIVANYDGPHKENIRIERNSVNLGGVQFGLRVWNLLSRANGELIVLAAGDDISDPMRCSELADFWIGLDKPIILIHSQAQVINEFSDEIGISCTVNSVSKIELENFVLNDGKGILGATQAFSRKLIDKFPPLNSVLRYEDGALAFRAFLNDGVLFLNKPLVKYRRHLTNITNGSELNDQVKFSKYLDTLRGQQEGFLRDYIYSGLSLDLRLLKAISRRIKQVDKMEYLFSLRLDLFFISFYYYTKGLTTKRKMWLCYYFFKLKIYDLKKKFN